MAYIDKELLLKDIYKNVRFSVKSGVISPELRGARKVIDRIENAPTADVEAVRHGEWIEVAENSTGKIMVCTNCKNCINPNKEDVAMNRASERPSYCPNCGAKMDGGKI